MQQSPLIANSPGASDQDIVLFVAGLVKMGEGVSACLHSISAHILLVHHRETVSWRVCSSFVFLVKSQEASGRALLASTCQDKIKTFFSVHNCFK